MTDSPKPQSPPGPEGTSPARSKTASPALRSETASPAGPALPNAPTDQTQIEADDLDDASTDDQQSTYTASLASSVVDYPTEHGRQYHAYRSGSYYGPNDDRELDRLDFMSDMVHKTLGAFYLAPIEEEKTHRILDMGTGTGIWAIEVSSLFPNAEIVGNDLSANQPTWVPPNVKFVVDDVESPWVGSKYDFIFARTLAGCILDWPKLVDNVYANINPGGWVEFQDWDIAYYSDDGTMTEEHESWKMADRLGKLCAQIGREPCPGPKLPQWVKDSGFVNVTQKKYKVPIGPWAKDPYFKKIGEMNLIQILEGLEAYNLRLLTGVAGWTKEEVHLLLAQVRKELTSSKFHSHMVFHVVYAQKPENAEEES
ncbi:Secondary metabolism regulator LAE1 [Colletotrichum orbiculare MAFF 240422]|uniref:Secondary metabolism regulator LAE1 n=1 Tax=Colletotrichum orbiculare (strain 104-T / ATCC 96160 / CBS 514.97 / LARS 414 / MAFF 240422) TaxID=1213857 RepID=A0A484FA53_COLOR|nr:Secondary metabolism regulator LAE1 [Colletotrichum orbiculare MAFF 240422]